VRVGYAGPVSRGLAFFVDTIVLSAVAVAGLGAVLVVGTALGRPVHASVPAAGAVLPVLLVGYLSGFWSLAGRTPGMALLGLRVVTARRSRPGLFASVVRAVVAVVFPVGFLWSLVDRRRQAVHDKVARTSVVRG